MKHKIHYYFLLLGLISLLLGVLIGCLAGLQYLFPDMFKEYLSFDKLRPLHVTSVISWLVLSISGGIYYYLKQITLAELFSSRLAQFHFFLFLLTGSIILIFLSMGIFGGREYLEFPPILSIPILAGWGILGLNYLKTLSGKIDKWPLYLWMWGTGILFLILTMSEAYLWKIPFFRDHIIRDITTQWKSYGALVGSLNMLIYGTALFVMYSIVKDNQARFGKLAFALYFIGLTNLLFGWGHHTYILPANPTIRYLAYFISMSELIVLSVIIKNWKRTLTTAQKKFHLVSYKFLFSADIWVAINLLLAIIISIPAINLFTHGTHITVAHAMGATIGINTCILLASIYYMLSLNYNEYINKYKKIIHIGFVFFHISLFMFWSSLILMGITRSKWMNFPSDMTFHEQTVVALPYTVSFVTFGFLLFIGLLFIALPAILIILLAIKKEI